jgi:radical SAM protein with 4Fe4S-binding SPASM domain
MKEDPRLAKVNAIVFLSLKQKGRGKKHEYVSQEQYKTLVTHCLDEGIRFGFDSCSAPSFLNAVVGSENYDWFKEHSEDCESTAFSSYINEKGEFFPCSFTEGWDEGGWSKENGINVLESEHFIDEVWNNPLTVKFRNALIGNKDSNGCRNCPAYAVCGIDKRLEMKGGVYKPLNLINAEEI